MEQDLHTLLASVRDDAPPPRLSVDDITAAGQKLVRRRRRTTLLTSVAGGVTAAVASITVALVLAAPGALTPAVDPSTLPSAVRPSPVPTVFADAKPFTTTYRGYETAGFQVSDPDTVTVAYQQSSIDVGLGPEVSPAPGGAEDATIPASAAVPAGPQGAKSRIAGLTNAGTLVVYRPGVFSTRLFDRGERLDMAAGPALLVYSGGNATGTSEDETLMQKQAPHIPTLAWQYAADAWAAIYWASWDTVPDRDALQAIAGGLKPADPRPFPVGFTASYVPKGYQLLSVSYGDDLFGDGRTLSVARLVPKLPGTSLVEPFFLEGESGLVLSMGRTDPNPKLVDKPICPTQLTCTRILDDDGTVVAAEFIDVKPPLQTTQVVLGIQPLDTQDMAGWRPATEVFG